MASWHIPRTSLMYAKEESSYGTAPTFSATDAVRHMPGTKLAFNPRNLAKSPERHTHPSQMALLTRRASASWALKAQMYPSGALNTAPELAALLKNSFGAAPQNITLSTTFTGTPTTTTGTVSSATGLVVGQFVQITIASGGSAGVYARLLTAKSGADLTWSPALPAAPASGDACKGVITWTPSTAIAASLDVAHYPQAPAGSTPARELLGCVVDQVVFDFDANLEPMITFSGPAKGYAGTSPNFTPQAIPGAFTTVGSESGIPSGLTGYFYWGGTLYEIEKAQITIKNNMELQNTALGTSSAKAFFRKGKREVTVKIDAKVSDALTLWTPLLGSTSGEVFLQLGTTSAKIWALSLPAVTLTNDADIPDGGDDPQNWSFEGTALGTSGNDEILLGAL